MKPSSWALLGVGAGALVYWRYRRRLAMWRRLRGQEPTGTTETRRGPVSKRPPGAAWGPVSKPPPAWGPVSKRTQPLLPEGTYVAAPHRTLEFQQPFQVR